MIVGIILIGLLVMGGVGYLIGEPTPTPENIQTSYRGIARTNLQGYPKAEIQYFIGAVAVFRVMLQTEGYGTWEEIEQLAVDSIPPTSTDNIILRKNIRVLIESMETKARYLAKAQDTDHEDPDIKRVVLTAALNGLTEGAMEALVSKKGKVPGMEAGR